ncbi:hypothetical protein QYF36_011322 [Acer negundo]|nr:hypothetical protein QYF36_011322 [Acer negundo]
MIGVKARHKTIDPYNTNHEVMQRHDMTNTTYKIVVEFIVMAMESKPKLSLSDFRALISSSSSICLVDSSF